MQEKKLEKIINELPEDLKKELEDFAQFLWKKKFMQSSKQRKLRLTWVGGLKEYRDKFTPLDLQKKALEWWNDDEVSVDTNVWLELLLGQERLDECKEFFQNVDTNLIALYEFSFYSIGIILFRLNKDELFEDFLDDIENSFISKIKLENKDVKYLLQVRKKYNLDFDDAYQYVVAEKYDLTIISFDSDFDRTELKRKTPREVLESERSR
jgi:hypothetical protein